MTLALMPAAGRQRAGCLAGAVLGVWLALALAMGAARADDADPFSATVTVDATADSVVKARETARLDGQRRALAAIAERLSGGAAAKLPKLDDTAITDLVASFSVANERMSAVRYVADYTFHFRPEATRKVLTNAGIAAVPSNPAAASPGSSASAPSGRPVVMLPVYAAGGQMTLWGDPNPWRDAWEQQPSPGGVRLAVPLGDAGDIAAIDAGRATAGNPDGLAAIARRNGGNEAIVALAAMRGPPDHPTGIDLTVKRYRAGQLVDTHAASLSANPGESADGLLRRVATEIAAQIGGGWKKETVAGYDQQGTLIAVMPITGLDDWVGARARIAAVPAVTRLDLVALSRQEATIEIGYVGSIDQLKQALAGISLDLVRADNLWRLARTGPAAAQ